MDLKKILYNNLKDSVGFHRSKKFKDWFRKEYPNSEIHHLLGSYTSIKTSDYCSVPVSRDEHQFAEENKSDFAIDNLGLMLRVMIKYIRYLEMK